MKPKTPPIDWLKAAILERMETYDYTREEVCKLSKISVPTFRTLMDKPVASWETTQRRAVLDALGIKIKDLPTDVQLSIARSL